MRIIEPSFEILTEIDGDKILKYLEKIGKVCYKSESTITEDSAQQFIKSIILRGHESVIEHVSITVRVNCDRGVVYEIIRHRLASYSQSSTRYCNFSKDKFGNEITVINPFFWECEDYKREYCECMAGIRVCSNCEKYKIWEETMEYVEEQYMRLIRSGATAQEARTILPNSLETEIVITMNLREWRHFFKLRTSQEAHPQMREISIPILEEFKRKLPIIFDDIKKKIDDKQ